MYRSGTRHHILGRRPIIFLAEDDPEMRDLLERALRDDDYDLVSVKDGTEMLEALSEASQYPLGAPDVIVMDVRMPGYSGLHILTALRAASWKTPVILMTGFGDARLHDEAVRFGAAAVFDKPFDVDDLRTALLHVLGSDARLRSASRS